MTDILDIKKSVEDQVSQIVLNAHRIRIKISAIIYDYVNGQMSLETAEFRIDSAIKAFNLNNEIHI